VALCYHHSRPTDQLHEREPMSEAYSTRQSQVSVDRKGSGGSEIRPGLIIAAIPCLNEERIIGSVVLMTREHVDEVVVVDDGSTDETARVAELAGARVLAHETNKGKGIAVNTAFDYAKKSGCAAMVLLDGDGQHNPVDIPRLLRPVVDGSADMVVGSRFMEVKSDTPGYRVWGQRVLTLFTNVGSRAALSDSQSGFRAFSARAIGTLTFGEEGLSVESEMQFKAKEANLRLAEVPINVAYYDRAKRSPVAHGMGVLNSILGLISRRIPLLFFGVPGIAALGVGLWEGWRTATLYQSRGEFYLGPALIAVMLCIVGILSIFTGLILHTIKSYVK
jgi:glycosyltransferase involved in cell wall biosynthesis